MRRETVVLVVLLTLGLVALPAEAEWCFDFVDYCDGLELTIEGDRIYGQWLNANCLGAHTHMVGVIQDGIPNPCTLEVDGRAGVPCDNRFGCEDFLGAQWYFVFNEPNGEVHLGFTGIDADPPGACGVGAIEYEVYPGPCPFFGPGSGKPMISSIQATQ